MTAQVLICATTVLLFAAATVVLADQQTHRSCAAARRRTRRRRRESPAPVCRRRRRRRPTRRRRRPSGLCKRPPSRSRRAPASTPLTATRASVQGARAASCSSRCPRRTRCTSCPRMRGSAACSTWSSRRRGVDADRRRRHVLRRRLGRAHAVRRDVLPALHPRTGRRARCQPQPHPIRRAGAAAGATLPPPPPPPPPFVLDHTSAPLAVSGEAGVYTVGGTATPFFRQRGRAVRVEH